MKKCLQFILLMGITSVGISQRPQLGFPNLLDVKATALCFDKDSSIVWFLRGERLDSIVHIKATCYLLKNKLPIEAKDPPLIPSCVDAWTGRWEKRSDTLYNGITYLAWLDMSSNPPYLITGFIRERGVPKFTILIK